MHFPECIHMEWNISIVQCNLQLLDVNSKPGLGYILTPCKTWDMVKIPVGQTHRSKPFLLKTPFL